MKSLRKVLLVFLSLRSGLFFDFFYIIVVTLRFYSDISGLEIWKKKKKVIKCYFLWELLYKIICEKDVESRHSGPLSTVFRNITNPFCLWNCLPVSLIHRVWLVPFSQTQTQPIVLGSFASLLYTCPPKDIPDLLK